MMNKTNDFSCQLQYQARRGSNRHPGGVALPNFDILLMILLTYYMIRAKQFVHKFSGTEINFSRGMGWLFENPKTSANAPSPGCDV